MFTDKSLVQMVLESSSWRSYTELADVKVSRCTGDFPKFDDSLINELRIMRHVKHLHIASFYGAVIDMDAGTVAFTVELLRGMNWMILAINSTFLFEFVLISVPCSCSKRYTA